MTTLFGKLSTVLAFGTFALFPSHSLACGGCFQPPSEQSAVTGHRMAFAVSEDRTVLWDQFEYEGDPAEFAWVLPVAPGAYVELADQAWFDALEGMTATQVLAPSYQCGSSGGGGCARNRPSFSSDLSAGGVVDSPSVTVLRRENVGPYETVVLRSDNANALHEWLDDNDYYVPHDIEPVIENYVLEGADFLALKLAPGVGVSRMAPVRVVTPGGDPLLPLRMVAAGVFDDVDIVLYVIAQGRHTIPDLEQKEVDPNDLVWDFRSQVSNYAEVRANLLADEDGRNVLTTYARQGPLTSSAQLAISTSSNTVFDTFANSYYQLAGESCQLGSSNFDQRVVDPCYGNPDADLLVACEDAAAEEHASSAFVCDELTDLAAALVGMVPSETWVTRLEMTLPRYALDMDCDVLAVDDDPIDSFLVATEHEGTPPCPPPQFAASLATYEPKAMPVLALFGVALVGICWRRRPSRTDRPRHA